MIGHLSLAGCGPYSEELVSSLLIDHIQQADVILYDRLINKHLLRHAQKDALIEYVGKSLNETVHTQEAINSKILSYLQANKRVVRLKSGDPFLFGRGFEEYQIARANNFEVTVIPGQSSSMAIASSIALPLTLRNISHGMTILTGVDAKQETPDFSFTTQNHSYVFLMSTRHFEIIAQKMIEQNFPSTTPAIAISNGTYPNQQIVCGRLDNIQVRMKQYNQANPAIIIVSPTINYWKEYYRPNLLSTKIEFSDYEEVDQKYHTKTTHLPLLKHQLIPLTSEQLNTLERASTIILASPITLHYAKNLPIQWDKKSIVALGPKTYEVAKPFFDNIQFSNETPTLASYIQTHPMENTICLTSTSGKDLRINEDYCEKIIPIFSLETTNSLLPQTSFDAITVYSPSTLWELEKQIQEQGIPEYATLPLFCFGQNVFNAAKESSFTQPILISTNDNERFYEGIELYFKERFSK